MARPEKVAKVEEIKAKFLQSQFVFLTDFTGLTVEEINQLRQRLRGKGAEYRVLKNTLTLLAIKDTDYQPVGELLVGPVAAVFASEDPVAVSKELLAFAAEKPKLRIKGGYMEGKVLSADEVRAIATLPSREVLLARVTGAFKGPLYGLHSVLSGPYRKLVYALRAVADVKAEAA